jgi:hypothetical protein
MEIDGMTTSSEAVEPDDGCIDGVKMPDRIWLVWEGGEITWADDPDPSGHSAQAVAYTRAPDPRLARLIAAATACADELEAEVTNRWGYDERLAHKLARDLAPVVELRAALDAYGDEA